MCKRVLRHFLERNPKRYAEKYNVALVNFCWVVGIVIVALNVLCNSSVLGQISLQSTTFVSFLAAVKWFTLRSRMAGKRYFLYFAICLSCMSYVHSLNQPRAFKLNTWPAEVGIFANMCQVGTIVDYFSYNFKWNQPLIAIPVERVCYTEYYQLTTFTHVDSYSAWRLWLMKCVESCCLVYRSRFECT